MEGGGGGIHANGVKHTGRLAAAAAAAAATGGYSARWHGGLVVAVGGDYAKPPHRLLLVRGEVAQDLDAHVARLLVRHLVLHQPLRRARRRPFQAIPFPDVTLKLIF